MGGAWWGGAGAPPRAAAVSGAMLYSARSRRQGLLWHARGAAHCLCMCMVRLYGYMLQLHPTQGQCDPVAVWPSCRTCADGVVVWNAGLWHRTIWLDTA